MNRHDRSRSRAMNHPMLSNNDLFRLGIVDHRDFYDIAFFRNFPSRCDDPGAERSERLARFFAQIANRQLETRSRMLRAMGFPIAPRPIKPILASIIFSLTSCRLLSVLEFYCQLIPKTAVRKNCYPPDIPMSTMWSRKQHLWRKPNFRVSFAL